MLFKLCVLFLASFASARVFTRQHSCIAQNCTGVWTRCNATCGTGVQFFNVHTIANECGRPCEVLVKKCHAPVPCSRSTHLLFGR